MREGGWVGVGAELASGLHSLESSADRALPPVEAAGELETGVIVALGELASERADLAAAPRIARLLERYERVGPGAQPVDRVELCEQLGLAGEDVVSSGPGDCAHEGVPVREIVVELALRYACASADIVD